MTKTKRITITALFAAICIVLPMAFHSIPNAGSIFLPMHIPVLMCGLICGWPYGLVCGVLGPLLSSLMTGMPPMAILPGMLCELAVYGLVTGLLVNKVRTGKKILDLYIPLIIAMLFGRVFYGLMNAIIFKAGSYSMAIWLASAFVTSLPGIVIQLVLIPLLVYSLHMSGLAGGNARTEKKIT
ncbi:MAG: ECF transporter S component [Clostridiales bacterium]|nr:ECF transporter S component [Clostridiales bacterium]